MKRLFCYGVIAAAIFPSLAAGQARPSFEVASVKRNIDGGATDFKPVRSGSRIRMHGVQLATVVIYAYDLAAGQVSASYQLEGNLTLPEGWTVYDIDAVVAGVATDDELRAMFQTLLEDRFRLRSHWITKQMPVYDLTIAKNGPRLTPTDAARALPPSSAAEPGVSRIRGRNVSMEQLMLALSGRLNRTVRNLTGLTGGAYDLDVRYASDANLTTPTSAADLPGAVEQELGLRLKASIGPVRVLVIDHVETPSGN